MCGVGGGVCVSVYDVTEGVERQSSGRPDSKRVTAEKEGKSEREAFGSVKTR